MPEVTATLRLVRSLFQKAGEADVLPFIQGTGFLLLLVSMNQRQIMDSGWRLEHLGRFDPDSGTYTLPTKSLSEIRQALGEYFHPDNAGRRDLIPLPPIRLRDEQLEKALGALSSLCSSAQGAGSANSPAKVFNLHLMVDFIETIMPGGRYPTPRHVAAHMARLVGSPADAQVADLACGSGSLLVAVQALCENAYLTGFEISGDWARLAWTNAVLYDVETTHLAILPRNSLQGETAPDEGGCYDIIVMNPPFGNREDPVVVRQALGGDSSSTSSEVIFPNLAIRRLKNDGVAMVLAPAGVLFRRSTAERELRRRLLEECTLRAVIAYPEDGFQPYSGLETHGLLFHKQMPTADHATWLFTLTQDGRTGVKNRQDDPDAPNQLSLVEAVLLKRGETVASISDASSTTLTEVHWFSAENLDEVAGPGRHVAGYWLEGQVAAIRMQRQVVCANDANQARAHWVTVESEDTANKRLIHLVPR